MNIFEALSQGKGRINEETMSAMLAFLLNPAQTHGIGDTFLGNFLEIIAKEIGLTNYFREILEQDYIHADVFLEEKYPINNRQRSIDIEIRLYLEEHGVLVEQHRIIIENKTKRGAAQANQLKEEFIAVRDFLIEDNDSVSIVVIFLTPGGNYPEFDEEFNNLSNSLLTKHKKIWLTWHDIAKTDNTITSIIRHILTQELTGKINPISEYVRHTLKAFAYFIESNISPVGNKAKNEIGALIEQVEVKLSDGFYVVEKYQSTSIRVFNSTIDEYVIAKPVLRRINAELNLGVDLNNSNGNAKNTRTLGKDIVEVLHYRNNNDQ